MQIKKLKSGKEREREERKKKIWMGVIISAIMVASTAAFALFSKEETSSSSSKQIYNAITFYKQNALWQASIKGSTGERTVSTYYLPQEIENITCERCNFAVLQNFNNKNLYFSLDSSIPYQAAAEAERNLDGLFIRAQPSCLIESENSSFCNEQNLPVKECPTEAGSESVVFELRKNDNNETKVLYYPNCIRIEASNQQDFIKAIDSLIFSIYGVKK